MKDHQMKLDEVNTESEIVEKRLDTFFELEKGKKPDTVLDEKEDEAIPYLVVDTMKDQSLKYTPDTDLPKAKKEDTVMIMDGSKSGQAFYGHTGVVGSTMAVLRPKNINPYYFNQFIKHNFNRLNSATKGSAVPHTDKDLLRSLEIIDFPEVEQQKIASVLYNVDRAIEKTEEIIEQTTRVKQGVMQDLFTEGYYDHDTYEKIQIGPFEHDKPNKWKLTTIERSQDGENGLRRGPFGGMLKKEIFVDSGYKVYQQQNVIYDDFHYGDYYISEEKFSEMERFSVEAGDLLISCSGTLGKIAIVPENYEKGVINQALLKFSVDESTFSNDFVKYFLESRIGQRQLVLSSRGSALKNMAPMEFVRSAKLFLPSKEEQEKIARTLASLDEKINIENSKKEQLLTLKKGLMQDLLAGNVRTTDSDIEIPQKVK